jgi:hypothetical protein
VRSRPDSESKESRVRTGGRDHRDHARRQRHLQPQRHQCLSTEGELGVWKQRLEKAEHDIDELHRDVAAAAQQGRGAALNVNASLKPQIDAVNEALEDSKGSGVGPYLSVLLIGLGLLLQAVASAMSIA